MDGKSSERTAGLRTRWFAVYGLLNEESDE
jgi:hypothetical protein